ncbi:AMP-binding protein [Sesbania bispinosa]|nr:AMP-binding protein [Sesbania bispinosa]
MTETKSDTPPPHSANPSTSFLTTYSVVVELDLLSLPPPTFITDAASGASCVSREKTASVCRQAPQPWRCAPTFPMSFLATVRVVQLRPIAWAIRTASTTQLLDNDSEGE